MMELQLICDWDWERMPASWFLIEGCLSMVGHDDGWWNARIWFMRGRTLPAYESQEI